MKTSCIAHPANEPLLILRLWQLIFCDGNHCAAVVMSFIEYWHNWKINTDSYNKKANDIAEQHGDRRLLDEDVVQFHTLQEISEGILGLYGVKAISEALKLLVSKKVIKCVSNPNKRYAYDKKKYINFYPEVCNEWIKNHYKSSLGIFTESKRQKGIIDSVKKESREGENALGQGEKGLAITEIYNKEVINQLIGDDHFLVNEENTLSAESTDDALNDVLVLLKAKGMSAERLVSDSDLALIKQAVEKGAGIDVFSAAYDTALAATAKKGNRFGVSYLMKVVDSVMQKASAKNLNSQSNPSQIKTEVKTPKYENDFSKALHWMGDLVK